MYELKQLGLKKADVFGYPISLRMNRLSNYKSSLGGCVSVTLFTLLLIYYSSSFVIFIQKQSLKVITTIEYENFPQQLNLDDSQFMLLLKIDQDNFIDNPMFNITLEQKLYIQGNNSLRNKISVPIELIPCTLDRFIFPQYGKSFASEFERLGLNQYLCPAQNQSMTIMGSYTNPEFKFLKISVIDCINTNQGSWQPKCASETIKQNYLQSQGQFNVNVYMINKIISPEQNDDSYIQLFFDDSLHFSFIPNSLKKQANIFVQNYQFQTDESLLPFSNIQERNFFNIDQSDTRETSLIASESDNNIQTSIFIKRSYMKTIVQRSYQKVDELLSNLGGIQQIFIFTIGVAITLYNKLQLTIELTNKVFEFSFDSTEAIRNHRENLDVVNELQYNHQRKSAELEADHIQKLNETQILQKAKNAGLKHQQNILQLPLNEEIRERKSFQLVEKHKKLAKKFHCKNGQEYFLNNILLIINRSKPILLNFKMLLNFLSLNKLFASDKSIILLRKGLEQISNKLDINHILTKITEFDKMKEIIFTYQQQVMFDFMPKPQISLDEKSIQPTRNMLESNKMKSPSQTMLYSNQQEDLPLENAQPTPRNVERESQPIKFIKNGISQQAYIMYAKIYNAYDEILKQSEVKENSKQKYVNKQLINKIGPELQAIFKISKILDQQQQNNGMKVSRRGAMQQQEDDLYVKMFESNI